MGSCYSSLVKRFNASAGKESAEVRHHLQLKYAKAALAKTGATKEEADALLELFNGRDTSRDGFLNQDEFFQLVSLPPALSASLRRRLFRSFARPDGLVSFSSFLLGLYSTLPLTRSALITLAFNLLAEDGSEAAEAAAAAAAAAKTPAPPKKKRPGERFVSGNAIVQLATELATDRHFSRLVDGTEASRLPLPPQPGTPSGRLKLTEATFARFALAQPAILYAPLVIQTELGRLVLGKPFWRTATTLRAGSRDVMDFTAWTIALTRSATQDGGLSNALYLIEAGRVAPKDLAPADLARTVTAEHRRLFGSTRSFVGMVRRASLALRSAGKSIRMLVQRSMRRIHPQPVAARGAPVRTGTLPGMAPPPAATGSPWQFVGGNRK